MVAKPGLYPLSQSETLTPSPACPLHSSDSTGACNVCCIHVEASSSSGWWGSIPRYIECLTPEPLLSFIVACPSSLQSPPPPGVHAEVATSRSEHWQKYSPLPFEVVMDAGRKARDQGSDASAVGESGSCEGANACEWSCHMFISAPLLCCLQHIDAHKQSMK